MPESIHNRLKLLREALRLIARAIRGSTPPAAPGTAPSPATWVPPGHFYSPIADLDDLSARAGEIFDINASVADVDLQLTAQRRLFDQLLEQSKRFEIAENKLPTRRYYWNNDQFGPGDATIYGAMLLHFRPKRVIEVGSGYSSALLLDINEHHLNGGIHCTFIEPYPDRLLSLLKHGERERTTLIHARVQTVPLETFDALEAGDFLFIDSTHVAKAGSDVNFELFTVLPRLKPGVLIHFHDTFYPFEYPQAWFFNGNRSWNELYLLRAFLMNNHDYRIVFFNSAVAHFNPDRRHMMPNFWKNPGGALWLVKENPGA